MFSISKGVDVGSRLSIARTGPVSIDTSEPGKTRAKTRPHLSPRCSLALSALLLLASASLIPEVSANPYHRNLIDSIPNPSDPDRFTKMVWLVDYDTRLTKFVRNKTTRHRILMAVIHEAQRQQLPISLVFAVMQVESTFRPYAVSRVNAQGLMQVMPFWLEVFEEPEHVRLFDIEHNIRIGCRILRKFLDRERGNWYRALLRYNGSLGSDGRYYRRVIHAARNHWLDR